VGHRFILHVLFSPVIYPSSARPPRRGGSGHVQESASFCPGTSGPVDRASGAAERRSRRNRAAEGVGFAAVKEQPSRICSRVGATEPDLCSGWQRRRRVELDGWRRTELGGVKGAGAYGGVEELRVHARSRVMACYPGRRLRPGVGELEGIAGDGGANSVEEHGPARMSASSIQVVVEAAGEGRAPTMGWNPCERGGRTTLPVE
jgi:hypothetical protein